MREAFPLEADPILEQIRNGWEKGMRKLTLLGGEPTIQPEFMNVVRCAVRAGDSGSPHRGAVLRSPDATRTCPEPR